MSRVGGFGAGVIAMVVACVIAGCGSDDSDDDVAAAAAAAPQAAGITHARLAERIGDWLSESKNKSDCQKLEVLTLRSAYRFKCPVPPKVRASMARFKVLDSEVYGSAALIGYRTGDIPDGAVMLMFVAPDGGWAVSRMGLLYEPDPGSSDEGSRDGFDKAVTAYLRAIRKRDCDLYYARAIPVVAPEKQDCKRELKAIRRFVKAVKANPDAKPEYLGGNRDFGFYGVRMRLPAPSYVTISVAKTTKGADQPYVVLNASYGPTPTR